MIVLDQDTGAAPVNATPDSPRTDTDPTRSEQAWDAALATAGGHLLQSWRWGALKSGFGWDVERVRVSGGDADAFAQVLFRRRGPVSVAYVPRGPAIRGDAGTVFPALVETLDRLCRERRALVLILEPDGPLGLAGSYRDAGFVRGPARFQPGRTVIVPLPGDEAMLAQMHQKHRYNVRLALRRGVIVERADPTEDALDRFGDLMRDTAERNGFGIHERAYYDQFLRVSGDDAVLLFARSAGEIAAVAMAARFGDRGTYMYGGSSTRHRAGGAAFLLQYEAMKWARDRGATTYDLWGIPEEDPEIAKGVANAVTRSEGEDWRGLYTFKTRFGGEVVSYPHPMERRHHPIAYALARRLGKVGGA